MPSILDTPPPFIQQELINLSNDLALSIPAKQLDRNILIATWNIRAFGDLTEAWEAGPNQSPKRDLHSLLAIVEIIKRFDIIAVQEVRANLKCLRHTMKLLGPDWAFLMTDVNNSGSGNYERLAFIYDTRKVKLSGLACEIVVPHEVLEANLMIGVDALQRQFVRTPYAVSFFSGGRTFVLLTMHVLYGDRSADRVPELKAIANWVKDWADELHSWDHTLLVLGDFNIVKRGDPTYEAFVSTGLQVPPELESFSRTIFKDSYSYYDQIAWFNNALSLQYKTGGVYDFRDKVLKQRNYTTRELSYRISDHFPLWAEFGV